MATFYNRATLSYNDTEIDSNIVSGELVEVLSATKNSLDGDYTVGDRVTYLVSIVNAGAAPYTNLTLTDNLGQYALNETTDLLPLTYVDGSLRYYSNGVLQTPPTVVTTSPLGVTGITVPANGNVLLVYEADVNQFAPLGIDQTIINTATISGETLTNDIVVTSSIASTEALGLTISKSICPDVVVENGEIVYTFLIQNTGPVAATAADNLSITDTFSPVLNPISVTFNGTPWTEGTNYTYDTTTGVFQTVPGQITVPAATYEQNEITGRWTVTPGVAVIKVTGTI